MPKLNSIKICKLSKEAQAKIDSKVEYRDKILHFLHNDDLFRIGNTNVSARTAVYLEKIGLLKEKKAKTGWRKLNFIDAIYFDLLLELRKFGMTASSPKGRNGHCPKYGCQKCRSKGAANYDVDTAHIRFDEFISSVEVDGDIKDTLELALRLNIDKAGNDTKVTIDNWNDKLNKIQTVGKY